MTVSFACIASYLGGFLLLQSDARYGPHNWIESNVLSRQAARILAVVALMLALLALWLAQGGERAVFVWLFIAAFSVLAGIVLSVFHPSIHLKSGNAALSLFVISGLALMFGMTLVNLLVTAVVLIIMVLIVWASWKAPMVTSIVFWSLVTTVTTASLMLSILPGNFAERAFWIAFMIPFVWVGFQFISYWYGRPFYVMSGLIGLSSLSTAIVLIKGPVV